MERKLFAIMVLLGVFPACLGQTDADCSAATIPPSACATADSWVVCEYTPTTGALRIVVPGVGTSPPPTACPAGSMCFKDVPNKPATPCAPAPPACTVNGTFAYRPAGCATYYQCVPSGTALQQFVGTCDTGFEFSEATLSCVATATAGCSVTTTPGPVTTARPPSPTTPRPSSSTNRPPTTSTPTNCFPGQRFQVTTNCRQFRACDLMGRMVTKQCPFRLKFDTTMMICRLNANCGSRPSIL